MIGVPSARRLDNVLGVPSRDAEGAPNFGTIDEGKIASRFAFGRIGFEAWRAQRIGRKRVPEILRTLTP